MEFLVLVEAKHHRHPIKREVVQVLESKIDRAVLGHREGDFSLDGLDESE
jgi:hypothetical protein